MSDYLTVEEAAELLRLSARTVREKMRRGDFRLGVHYFRPARFRPRFKRSALIELIEGGGGKDERKDTGISIPMRRGYNLGG